VRSGGILRRGVAGPDLDRYRRGAGDGRGMAEAGRSTLVTHSVFCDAIRVKIRDEGFVRNKAVYIAPDIQPDGTKEVLGI